MCLQSVPAVQPREGFWDSYMHPTCPAPTSSSCLVSHICKENVLKWPHVSQLLSSLDTFSKGKEKGGKTQNQTPVFRVSGHLNKLSSSQIAFQLVVVHHD